MAKAKDPSITFLNKYGFNVVKLPRTGIEPLNLVGRDTTTLNLGPIRDIWQSAVDEPEPLPARPTAAVNGMKTDALDVSFGLDILANALAAFGATVPSLKTAYQQAHSIHFAYTNVTMTSVPPLAVGKYLAAGKLDTDNPQVTHYFDDPKCEVYIILDVLKSDSIMVTATDSHGVSVGVDVPAIQGVVGAHVAVKPSDSSNSSITFTGPEPLSFGFSVQQIARVGDKWTLHGVAPSGHIAFGIAVPAGQPQPTIFDSGPADCRIEI